MKKLENEKIDLFLDEPEPIAVFLRFRASWREKFETSCWKNVKKALFEGFYDDKILGAEIMGMGPA